MKITANIATMPGRESHLAKMIDSIYHQFDEIRVVCNGMKQPPKCLELPRIKPIILDEDLTDNGKFFFLDQIKSDEYFFTLDDDIVYPDDYVEKTIEAMDKYGCIITYHGRVLKGEALKESYYKGHYFFHCAKDVDKDLSVDVCGTGVTAFNTKYFHPKGLAYNEYQRMSDIIFSLEAHKQSMIIGLINHKAGWIKPLHVSESIFNTERNTKQTNQIKLANEIYRIKNT